MMMMMVIVMGFMLLGLCVFGFEMRNDMLLICFCDVLCLPWSDSAAVILNYWFKLFNWLHLTLNILHLCWVKGFIKAIVDTLTRRFLQ